MALLEKHRNTIYNHFLPLIGEEATEGLMSQFAMHDVDEAVTREHLDRRLAEQNAAIERVRAEMHQLHNRTLAALITVVSVATGLVIAVG